MASGMKKRGQMRVSVCLFSNVVEGVRFEVGGGCDRRPTFHGYSMKLSLVWCVVSIDPVPGPEKVQIHHEGRGLHSMGIRRKLAFECRMPRESARLV